MQRRRFVALTGALATGGTALAITATDRSEAAISLGTLDVPDVNAVLNGGEITAINLTVDAEYTFSSSHNIDEWTLELLVGDSDTTLEPIDSASASESLGQSGSGTETLSGDATSTYHFALDEFEPANGGSVSHLVWVGLRFRLKRNAEVVAEETVSDSVTVAVDGGSIEASASVGGEGTLSVETAA